MYRFAAGKIVECEPNHPITKLEWYPDDEVENRRVLAEQVVRCDVDVSVRRCSNCRSSTLFSWISEQGSEFDPQKSYKRMLFSCGLCSRENLWKSGSWSCTDIMFRFNSVYPPASEKRALFKFVIPTENTDSANSASATDSDDLSANASFSTGQQSDNPVDIRKALETINVIAQMTLQTPQASENKEQAATNKAQEETIARLLKEVKDLKAQIKRLKAALAE